MTNTTDAACAAAKAPDLPDDTRRLIEIEDAIAKIRTQIATADLTRQRTAIRTELFIVATWQMAS